MTDGLAAEAVEGIAVAGTVPEGAGGTATVDAVQSTYGFKQGRSNGSQHALKQVLG